MASFAREPQYGVYQIKNTITGRVYIGVTTTRFCKRWDGHISELMRGDHNNRALQEEWNRFGYAAFAFSIVEICGNADLAYAREVHLIDTAPVDAYNVARGDVSPQQALDTKRWIERTKNKHRIAEYFRANPDTPKARAVRELGISKTYLYELMHEIKSDQALDDKRQAEREAAKARVLAYAAAHPGASKADIARGAGISKTLFYELLKELEAAGRVRVNGHIEVTPEWLVPILAEIEGD